MVQDGLLYYLFDRDEEVRPRLYIPKLIREDLLKQIHNDMGHMGVDKTYELIGRKNIWPRLYKEVTNYINSCVISQTWSSKCENAPLEETDVPSYPFEKISMNVSGPYGETAQGSKYLVSFVDWLTNLPEAFAVPDKKAQTVAGLLLTEIVPRFRTPLELVSDNRPENVNEIMRQTVKSLNIKHIVTSPYHPQSKAKVERFHRFLGDTIAKLNDGEKRNWDLFLTQDFGRLRFSINEVTRFSSYFLLFGQDVIAH